MKKIAQLLEDDVDTLIQRLMGKTPPPSSSSPKELLDEETYQLPLKHTREGKEIDEENEPWVVGHFIPGVKINETHPHGHEGVDLKAPRGSPVFPIASGEVIEARQYPKGGKTVKVSHEDGQVISYYAHLDDVYVSPGEKVSQSTQLGAVGDTGNAKGRGAHLHYEVRVSGQKKDPQSITGKRVGSLAKKAEFIRRLTASLEEEFSDRKKGLFVCFNPHYLK